MDSKWTGQNGKPKTNLNKTYGHSLTSVLDHSCSLLHRRVRTTILALWLAYLRWSIHRTPHHHWPPSLSNPNRVKTYAALLLFPLLVACTTTTITRPDGTVVRTTSQDPIVVQAVAAGVTQAAADALRAELNRRNNSFK